MAYPFEGPQRWEYGGRSFVPKSTCELLSATNLSGFGGGGGLPVINLTIAADTNNYNLFTAAGSPGSAVVVNLTVNSGVNVGSTSTSNPALDIGTGWAAGCIFNIFGPGKIGGKPGAGGAGGRGDDNAGITAGQPGGNAIDLRGQTVTADATLNVWGGGGGGGAGNGSRNQIDKTDNFANGGGGGGGGGGVNPGAGGAHGPAQYQGNPGVDGDAGTTTTGGAGHVGGVLIGNGGTGGDGGGPGQDGNTGTAASNIAVGSPTAGGTAGKAVNLNGGAINITTNGTTVRGVVS